MQQARVFVVCWHYQPNSNVSPFNNAKIIYVRMSYHKTIIGQLTLLCNKLEHLLYAGILTLVPGTQFLCF